MAELNIETRQERERGCGYRKPGGLYMVSGGEAVQVSCLPIPLHVCPTCSQGVKPTRSFQWIEPGKLLPQLSEGCTQCTPCPLWNSLQGTQGLMWVGDKFYTPQSFMEEGRQMGISKRIPAVPKNFEVGKHWIFLGHRKAIEPKTSGVGYPRGAKDSPGIFTVFKPTAIEYVVDWEKDDQKKLEGLQKRGITLVDVEQIKEQEDLGL